MLRRGCKRLSIDTTSITDTKNTVIATALSVSSEDENAEQISSQIVSVTLKQILPKIGFGHLASSGIS
jgi:hypothetical protein